MFKNTFRHVTIGFIDDKFIYFMKTVKLGKDNIDEVVGQTVKVIKSGGLVVYPSDTVYGLLVDGKNEEAVSKLISFKNRAPGKAISVFVKDIDEIGKYAEYKKEKMALVGKLVPGPFTLIFDSKHKVSRRLESETGTIGLRIPDFYPVQKLVSSYGSPITATSANLGGRHPNYSIQSLLNQLPESKKKLINLVVDAGKLPRNQPSTVVDLTTDKIKFLRKGDIIFDNSASFISTSPKQTRQLGNYLASKMAKEKPDKPIVFILKGDLGAGKTEMTRGIAEHFGIENIVSPTFVIYYEYDIQVQSSKFKVQNLSKFIHVDLYNIIEEEEFDQLGFEKYLVPGNVIVFEWGEKIGDSLKDIFGKARVVFVELNYVGENKREIKVES